MDEVSQLLLDAAEVMSERGLQKGAYVNPETGREVCLMGALHVAAGWKSVRFTNYWRLEGPARLGGAPPVALERSVIRLRAALRRSGEGSGFIPRFNDHSSTTVEDAVLMLKRAAEDD